jgi:hypothetical protein
LWPNLLHEKATSTGLFAPIQAIGCGFFSHFAQSASVPPAAVQKWQKPLAASPSFPRQSLPLLNRKRCYPKKVYKEKGYKSKKTPKSLLVSAPKARKICLTRPVRWLSLPKPEGQNLGG